MLKKIEKISEKMLHNKTETQTKIKSLQLAAKRIGKKSIVFIVSSFDDISDDMKQEISTVSFSNDVYMVNIYDNLELIAPPKGEYMAEYAGNQQLIISSGADYAQQYEAYFVEKRKNLKKFCVKFNCKYREIRTDLPIFEQLRPI